MEERDAACRVMQLLQHDAGGAEVHCSMYLGACLPPRGFLMQVLESGTARL